jgi:endonuclease/exonuclease/phosphatase family metal-dependent hydrolase
MRLSSKSHWDVPVRPPGGPTIHVLAAHPTPPGFDGAADRNGRRNHDEIRLLADYIGGADYVRSDSGHVGGLGSDARFVVLGDMNADPNGGGGRPGAAQQLTEHPRVQGDVVPTATPAGRAAFPEAGPEDTTPSGLRIDYALPSAGLAVIDSGVWRPAGKRPSPPVSDHFPVWVEVAVGGR